MGDDVVYIRPSDWWPELYQKDTGFCYSRAFMVRCKQNIKWHAHISTWMENSGYEAMNNEKTIFMKGNGAQYIIHGLFVDDMMDIHSFHAMKELFLA